LKFGISSSTSKVSFIGVEPGLNAIYVLAPPTSIVKTVFRLGLGNIFSIR